MDDGVFILDVLDEDTYETLCTLWGGIYGDEVDGLG
jgi:hypothetical protein